MQEVEAEAEVAQEPGVEEAQVPEAGSAQVPQAQVPEVASARGAEHERQAQQASPP